MPARFRTKDRVLETSVTTGTGTYTVLGASTGFQPFLGGDVAANDYVPYFATDGTNWEVGIGQVLSGPSRLARTAVLKSSNANAAVNWPGNTISLYCGWGADLDTPRVKSVSIAGAAGTQVLTQEEQRCDILVLTGAITGNRVIEVDTCPWRWPAVVNNTTGAFTVTLKVNGATGVTITQTKSRPLYNDGTDVKDPFTDLTSVSAATESAAGIIEIATQSETDTGTDDQRAITPLKHATTPHIKHGTQANINSGTSVDVSGLPSGLNEIDIHFESLSTNGTSPPCIQLRDSGGVENSGYFPATANYDQGNTQTTQTSAFPILQAAIAANNYTGTITLKRKNPGTFTWMISGRLTAQDGSTHECSGSKSLSAELDGFRITTISGADNFDGSGTYNYTTRK